MKVNSGPDYGKPSNYIGKYTSILSDSYISKAISAKGQNIAANKRLSLWTRKILPIRDLLFL